MASLNKSTKLVVLSVVLIILLVFLHYIRILQPIENLFVRLISPILRVTYQASDFVGEKYLDYKTKDELLNENKKLRDQIASLLQEKSLWLSEREENDFLSKQMSFATKNNYDFEIARVIGKNVDETRNVIVVDKGENSGLKAGMPVMADQGMLVGKIMKVNKNDSLVLLVNDDLSKVAAKIQNESRTIGIIEGEFGLGMKMRLIPQTEQLKEEDIVVTSGLEENIPQGLIIGQIESITKEPENLFQEASIKSFVDFNRILLVNIIKGKK